MLDLDSLESLQINPGPVTLYLTFAQWLCLEKISYVDFQKISKWTNVYHYVLPDQREIYPLLLDTLFDLYKPSMALFSLALLVSHIEANISIEQQILLLERLKKKGAEDGKIAGKP